MTVQDTTAPTLSNVPVDQIVEATSGAGALVTFALPSASDAVDSSLTISSSHASGSIFALGLTTVSYTATDDAGNSSSGTFTVTVQDTTAPTLSNVPVDQIVQATSGAGAVVSFALPTSSDAVDPDPTVSCTPASGSIFPLGVTTVTCTSTDDGGNFTLGSFQVTLKLPLTGRVVELNDHVLGWNADDLYEYLVIQDGVVTVQALFSNSGGNVRLEVRDSGGNLLGSSTGAESQERVDVPAYMGDRLEIRVLWPESNTYDLKITNTVQRLEGNELLINGTDLDDVIVVGQDETGTGTGNLQDITLAGAVRHATMYDASILGDVLGTEPYASVQIIGGAGHDKITVDSSVAIPSKLIGGVGHDRIQGGSGHDVIFGNVGNDLLEGGAGNDTLNGGLDNDSLIGGSGSDRLLGQHGDDLLKGGSGKDVLKGAGGQDILLGGNGRDVLDGQRGNDLVIGGAGSDRLLGRRGRDVLLGDILDDPIGTLDLRRVLNDWLAANTQRQKRRVGRQLIRNLLGDGARDRLTGGGGADLFAAAGTDQIADTTNRDVRV